MLRRLDAIFEDGVLRPLEPLELSERQRVRLIVDDAPAAAKGPEVDYHRYAEMAWIGANAKEYAGQWVALIGSRLVAHGHDPIAFRQAVKDSGVENALFHHFPTADELPFGCW